MAQQRAASHLPSLVVLLLLTGCAKGEGPGDVRKAPPAAPVEGTRRSSSASAVAWTGSTSNGVAPGWGAESDQAHACFGASVASAGDVNGDGYDDVVVGANGYSDGQSYEGAAFLYLGSATGPSEVADWSAQSGQVSAGFGWSVASAGDVNGDGYADLVVGAYAYDDGATDEGAAFVYLGSPAGPSVAAAWMSQSDHASALFGRSVASAGDVDGDGYDDLVIGAHWYDGGESKEGAAFLYLGSPAGPSASAEWTAESDQASAGFGCSVASAGDVNADGYDDLVVGASAYDGGESNEGAAFLYLGSPVGPSASADWTADSDQASAYFGYSVASAGDVNADGFGDVLVGAIYYDDGESAEGAAFLYLGTPSGPSPSVDWIAQSDQANAYLGWSVASAGDVNADGYGDLVVGALNLDDRARSEGVAFLYLGSPSGPSADADWEANSSQEDAELGASVATGGDVNGDGYGDLLVGARLYDDDASSEGAAWLWYGAIDFPEDADGFAAPDDCDDADPARSPGLPEECDGIDNNCDGVVDDRGDAVPFHPDADGDGFGDPAVFVDACPAPIGYVLDATDCDDGDPTVHPGAAESLDAADQDCDGFVDEQDGALSGSSVAYIGDINKDGYGDLVVGAPGAAGEGAAGGAATLYLGSEDGLVMSSAWVVSSDQAAARFGQSVAAAGDVNGDGYPDVLVGADGYGDGEPNEGRAYLYLGAASGLSTTPAWTAESNQAYARFGASVSGAGDVNRDGFDDVLIGSVGYDGAEVDEGRVDLYLGSALGLSTTPDWTVTSGQAGALLGGAVAGAGDVNADGYADVLVGAFGFDGAQPDAGAAYLYLGSEAGLSAEAAWAAVGDAEGAAFGAAVAGAGDVDGDGFADVIVGAPRNEAHLADLGSASVYLGSSSGLALAPVRTFQATEAYAHTGLSVAGAGDINGDGFDDVVFSAPGERTSNGGAGRVWMCLGSASGPEPSAIVVAEFDAFGVQFGWSVASSADLNGDAFADIVVGVPGYDDPVPDMGTTVVRLGGVDFWTDADGYGAPDDCDDEDPAIHPDATEECDGIDNDCDGVVDESGSPVPFYADSDGDGYGDPTTRIDACPPPAGYVLDARDCDDSNAAIYPRTSEVCDGRDNDCDGAVDEAFHTLWYADADGDGYGDAATTFTGCAPPAGYVTNASDCDDSNSTVRYPTSELCDGRDNDCDGAVDEGYSSFTWYLDADGDGYGDPGAIATACSRPAGYVSNDDDCDDAVNATHPGATESCNSLDDDCDGGVDEGLSGGTWFVDEDGDGYGAMAPNITSCTAPAGYVSNHADCDDTNADLHERSREVCDGLDNDCDGSIDESFRTEWYADADGDGYGDAGNPYTGCTPPAGYVTNAIDCDDTTATVYTAAPEVCDGLDNDCDGTVDERFVTEWYADADGDGYGTGSASTNACEAPPGYVAGRGDCDDADASVNPSATELCDGFDDDCDGLVDGDDPEMPTSTWYADVDGDGYGDAHSALTTACPPAGYVTDATDCDDSRADVHPNSDEVPDDGADNNCDGEKAVTKGDYGSTDSAPSGCGCSTSAPRSTSGGLVLLLAIAGARRRRARSVAPD